MTKQIHWVLAGLFCLLSGIAAAIDTTAAGASESSEATVSLLDSAAMLNLLKDKARQVVRQIHGPQCTVDRRYSAFVTHLPSPVFTLFYAVVDSLVDGPPTLETIAKLERAHFPEGAPREVIDHLKKESTLSQLPEIECIALAFLCGIEVSAAAGGKPTEAECFAAAVQGVKENKMPTCVCAAIKEWAESKD